MRRALDNSSNFCPRLKFRWNFNRPEGRWWRSALIMKRNTKYQKGFTIVELMVAILILSTALTASTGMFVLNNASANLIRNSYIASGLAQEGIELARNLRDSDWFASRPFGSFGDALGVAVDGDYNVQWNDPQLRVFSDTALNMNQATGIFSYDAGALTPFKRKITITTVSAVEKKVVVTVSWDQKGAAKSLTAEEHLFNWR